MNGNLCVGFIISLLMLAGCAPSNRDSAPSSSQSELVTELDKSFAIVGATILTMDGPAVENGMVIVQDGTINAVGVDAEIPSEIPVIDAQNKFVMPGLADMHAHYFREIDGPLYIANGVTTVRNLWGRTAIIEIGAASEAKGFPGPRIITSGPIMDGPEPIWNTSLSIASPELAVGAVRSQHATGYTAIKLYEGLDANTYRAAVEEAKRLGMQIWSHTPDSLTVDDLLQLQINSLEHLDNIEDMLLPDDSRLEFETVVDFPSYVRAFTQKWAAADTEKMAPVAQRFAEAGVANTPTMAVISDSGALMFELDSFFGSDEGQIVDSFLRESWSAEARVMAAMLDEDLIAEARAKKLLFIKALYDAGAPLLLGTDTPNPFVVPGFSLHREVAAFEEAGISRLDILELATHHAADFLNQNDVFGRVSPGLRADLLILDGDPREDLNTLKKPSAVIAGGTYYSRSALDSLLAEARRRALEDAPEAGDGRSAAE